MHREVGKKPRDQRFGIHKKKGRHKGDNMVVVPITPGEEAADDDVSSLGTAVPPNDLALSAFHEPPVVHDKGLSRRLTCSVVAIVFTGVAVVLFLQVGLVLSAVPDWCADAKNTMIESELAHILKLASDKAQYVTEIFERVEEGVLQLQAFAEQVLLETPETMQVDSYLASYAGLGQTETTWDHSVWFITDDVSEDAPVSGSSLDGLLNRTSLMDVQFRGTQRQHLLTYVAALDDPSLAEGRVSDINLQSYAGFNSSDYLKFNHSDCDSRFSEYPDTYIPMSFEPRCRIWYQDAVEGSNTGTVFTDPYIDQNTQELVVTAAAPVFNITETTLLLGVVAIDLDFTTIEASIYDLKVIDEEGYAYMLAPGGDGAVVFHRNIASNNDSQTIQDLEQGVDEEEFGNLVTSMSENCSGSGNYTKSGETWLLSWAQETGSSSATSGSDACNGFVVVVTITESALLQEFSEMKSDLGDLIVVARVVMAVMVLVVGCVVAWFARTISNSITTPVNQLIDVVRAFNCKDFSQQAAGTWMVNKVTSPELVDLMNAFESMVTIVKFANITLGKGDAEIAKQSYEEALTLFTKLGNAKGVGIVRNNLGNACTLQAHQIATNATAALNSNRTLAEALFAKADGLYSDAVTNFRQAIADAEILCTARAGQADQASPLPVNANALNGETKEADQISSIPADVETGGAVPDSSFDGDLSSDAALVLQLSNRLFNLALCLGAKSDSAMEAGGQPDIDAINEARELILRCIKVIPDDNSVMGYQRHVEYHLALAKLEHKLPGRQREADEALDAAQRVINAHPGDANEGYTVGGGLTAAPAEGEPSPAPIGVLQQQLQAARGAHWFAAGKPESAIACWTDAIIGCGNRMDIKSIRSSLNGLRGVASTGSHGPCFSSELTSALNLQPGSGKDPGALTSAIDCALVALKQQADASAVKTAGIEQGLSSSQTNVDLCFVMDCTGSMKRWIDQAKDKLFDIIDQAKKDVANVNLRVAFVGYRDFGDKVQYEGPYDFHTEEKLPSLLAKLKKIKACGGKDIPEDVAGGLQLATQLSWRSPARLCILIADAPSHGTAYHDSVGDRYPAGCPKGRDPAKLLYILQYELGVDFYFTRITFNTDQMINLFQTKVASFNAQYKGHRPALKGTTNTTPKFVIHNLGSDDNRFLEAVVQSVKVSVAGLNLRVEVLS